MININFYHKTEPSLSKGQNIIFFSWMKKVVSWNGKREKARGSYIHWGEWWKRIHININFYSNNTKYPLISSMLLVFSNEKAMGVRWEGTESEGYCINWGEWIKINPRNINFYSKTKFYKFITSRLLVFLNEKSGTVRWERRKGRGGLLLIEGREGEWGSEFWWILILISKLNSQFPWHEI